MIDYFIKDNVRHYVPTCDICGLELDDFETHSDAVEALRRSEWLTRYNGATAEYENYCEECRSAVKAPRRYRP